MFKSEHLYFSYHAYIYFNLVTSSSPIYANWSLWINGLFPSAFHSPTFGFASPLIVNTDYYMIIVSPVWVFWNAELLLFCGPRRRDGEMLLCCNCQTYDGIFWIKEGGGRWTLLTYYVVASTPSSVISTVVSVTTLKMGSLRSKSSKCLISQFDVASVFGDVGRKKRKV